uniref:FAM86 N-terminal domain-containing protein n=1 Tax=Acrobeloides nanus TaxID=290746 RepID=A0A914C8M3_9BILA
MGAIKVLDNYNKQVKLDLQSISNDESPENICPQDLFPKFILEIKDKDVLIFIKYYMAGVEITESLLDSFINFVRKDNAEGYEVMMLKRIISKLQSYDIHIDDLFSTPKCMNELENQDVLKFFNYYLSEEDIDESLIDSFINFIILHKDSALISEIFHSQIMKVYPLNKCYQIRILKRIVSKLEASEVYIDAIYELFSKALFDFHETAYSYRCFLDLKLEDIILVRKMDSQFIFGTTGMTTWRSSAVLSEYIYRFCDFDNKNILELGAGCGLTGMVTAKYHKVKSLCLTDGNHHVLEQLKENVRLNFSEADNINIELLDWDNFEENQLQVKPDIILGADIIYDDLLFPGICKTLAKLLSNSDVYAIFAYNIRSKPKPEIEKLDAELAQYNLFTKKLCVAWLPTDKKGIDFEPNDGTRIRILDEIFCSNYSFERKNMEEKTIF